MDETKKRNRKKEIMIFLVFVFGMGLIGTADSGAAALSFAGLGMVIWLFWRGRHL